MFEPLDTLFFRDGRPFDAGESHWARSLFPPSPYTLQGAIRQAVVEGQGIDVGEFARACRDAAAGRSPGGGTLSRLMEAVGDTRSLGRLRLTGPFVVRVGEIQCEFLYPAPLDLYRHGSAFGLLSPSPDPLICDLGTVRLPRTDVDGIEILEGWWLSREAMSRVLAGDAGHLEELRKAGGGVFPLFPSEEASADAALAQVEHRIGLGRDPLRRTAKEGLLYSLAHVRLKDGVAVGVVVGGLPENLVAPADRMLRFGGEGRLVRLRVTDAPPWPDPPPVLNVVDGRVRFKLVLTTPALMQEDGGWLPGGFARGEDERDGSTVWRGDLQVMPVTGGPVRVPVRVVSACVGRAVRLGGWDLARGEPRPLSSHVPAGSVYFCEADAAQEAAVRLLHGAQIGLKTAYGFGHVLLGTW